MVLSHNTTKRFQVWQFFLLVALGFVAAIFISSYPQHARADEGTPDPQAKQEWEDYITAVRFDNDVEGDAVPYGEFFHHNLRERVKFTAHFPNHASVTPTWRSTSGGHFIDPSTGNPVSTISGESAVWEVDDDFISYSWNDISVTCDGSDLVSPSLFAEGRFTVFMLNGNSGILAKGTTRTFKVTGIQPALIGVAAPVTPAAVVARLNARTWVYKAYINGTNAQIVAQAGVANVVTAQTFVAATGVKIQVTAGANAGDVNICTLNPTTGTLVHREHMTVVDELWTAWPGGQGNTALNPVETISTSDFGLTGNANWDVGTATRKGTILLAGGGTAQTAATQPSIRIRYDDVSQGAGGNEAVVIQVTQGAGGGAVTKTQKRTVFKVDWDAANTAAGSDADDNLSHPADTGTNARTSEYNWLGDNGATRIAGKVECVLQFSPQGIDWISRGVDFVYVNPVSDPLAYQFRLQRERKGVILQQAEAPALYRTIGGLQGPSGVVPFNDPNNFSTMDWPHSHSGDTQYPTVAKPNKAFSVDGPGGDPTHLVSFCYRASFKEVAQWYDGAAWQKISDDADGSNSAWHFTATADLPNAAKHAGAGFSEHGAGVTASAIVNTAPVATPAFAPGAPGRGVLVTLQGNGTDADHDSIIEYQWAQTAGPAVVLGGGGATARNPTFTTPAGAASVITFTLVVRDSSKNVLSYNPSTFQSAPVGVTITVP